MKHITQKMIPWTVAFICACGSKQNLKQNPFASADQEEREEKKIICFLPAIQPSVPNSSYSEQQKPCNESDRSWIGACNSSRVSFLQDQKVSILIGGSDTPSVTQYRLSADTVTTDDGDVFVLSRNRNTLIWGQETLYLETPIKPVY